MKKIDISMAENFKCKRCGACCRSPRLYKQDIEKIKNLGLKEKHFVYTDNFGNKYAKEMDGWCIFLDHGKKTSCVIYENRPKICRQYPLELVDNNCQPRSLAFDKFFEKRMER